MLELYFPILKAIFTEPKKIEIKPEPVAIVEEVEKPVSIEEMIRQTFGEAGDEAIAVATCESHLDPLAYNQSGSKGIFQIMPVHEHRIKTGKNFFDIETNIQVAFEIYMEQNGFQAWVCQP